MPMFHVLHSTFFACAFVVILAVIISFALPKPSKMIEEATYPLIHAWNQNHPDQSILYKPQRMKWCRKIEIKPAKLELQNSWASKKQSNPIMTPTSTTTLRYMTPTSTT